MPPALTLLLVTVATTSVTLGKVYDRCGLVRELSQPKHRIPPRDLATWVCIAEHESRYNTSAVGRLNADNSGDHGLFQISDLYWCSPPGRGKSCGITCALLEDDNIADDIVCALTVHRTHGHRGGGGFTAWTVYKPFCSGDVSHYVRGCDPRQTETGHTGSTVTTQHTPKYPTSTTAHPMLTYDCLGATCRNSAPTRPSTVPGKVTKKPSRKPAPTRATKTRPSSDVTRKPPGHPTSAMPHNPHDKFIIDDTGKITRVNDIPTSQAPRSRQTGFPRPRRPALKSDPDPSTAWHNIHHDPRFLDEFP